MPKAKTYPLMWIEARCDGMPSAGADNCGRIDCDETAMGGFYQGLKPAVDDTRRQGWLLLNGEWFCTRCRKRLHPDRKR
jgi:hypothetical protein